MEFIEVKLGDIIEILDSQRVPLSSQQRSLRQGNFPYYGAQGVIDHIDGYLFDGEYILIAEDGNNVKTRQEDIAQIAKGKFWVNNHAHIVKSQINQKLLCFILNHTDISGYVTGSAQPKLNQANLVNIPIKLPSKTIQDTAANILSSLDAKIENNNKINANLEAQASALFKSWFVDFEPFRDGEFVESELGMIPKGWKVIGFPSFIKASTEKVGIEGVPEFSVTNTGIHPRDEKFNKTLSKSTAKNKLLKKGNLVFGMSREILNWGVMEETIGGVSSAYNVYIINENIVSPLYVKLFIKHQISLFHDLIKPATREGQGLDKNALMAKYIYLPSSDVWSKFLSIYTALYDKIKLLDKENQRLSSLRDTLLPKLMSGEIDLDNISI